MTMCQGSRNGNRRSIQVIYFDSQQASEDKDTGKPNEIERLTFGLERGCRKSTSGIGNSPALYSTARTVRGAGQLHMEFAVVEGWRCLLGEWRYQLGSRVPERRGTRVGAFLCS